MNERPSGAGQVGYTIRVQGRIHCFCVCSNRCQSDVTKALKCVQWGGLLPGSMIRDAGTNGI